MIAQIDLTLLTDDANIKILLSSLEKKSQSADIKNSMLSISLAAGEVIVLLLKK